MGVRVFTTKPTQAEAVSTVLITVAERCPVEPDHPHGGEWSLFAEIFEDPSRVIASQRHRARLKKDGWIISGLPLEQLIKPRA